jgi:dihydrolipoamide dehydrogenase
VPDERVDLVVIGSGPGGYRAAVLAALNGMQVAIVEAQQWGGTCLNRGCVPKKAWYHSARLIAASRDFAGRGIGGALTGDLAQAWRHQKEVVARVRASYLDYLKRLGVACFVGTARFSKPGAISVDAQTLHASHTIIATGSAPFEPPALPRSAGRVLTTDDLFDAGPPPGTRVAVIGSGVIGTEFAFILRMLGRKVVWITQHTPLELSAYSEPARKALVARLGAHGIAARTGGRVVRYRLDDGGVILGLPDGEEVRVDWALLGAGRMPRSAALGLKRAGVSVNAAGFIEVDEMQRTSARGVYAIGDVANPAMTSNHALADAAVAVEHIIAPDSARARRDDVPQVVYSALELARIGLNEDAAEARGFEPAIGFTSFATSPAALVEDDAEGFVRIVADSDSGRLLGAELAGAHAGELIQLIGLEFGSPDALQRLSSVAYNHPARAEEILNAVETLAARWGINHLQLPHARRRRQFTPR